MLFFPCYVDQIQTVGAHDMGLQKLISFLQRLIHSGASGKALPVLRSSVDTLHFLDQHPT